MLKEVIKEAKTVEEAVELAAAELGVTADALTVEVLREPQKKALGLFGGTDAQIRATVKEQSVAGAAESFLRDVLAGMGVEQVTITATEEDGNCTLLLEGEDLGFIIGRRGDTLDALQYLTSLVANRVGGAYHRISINIGNYREKREKTLSGLAHRAAVRAAKNGRNTSLEPMNPYERRIIHTAVQKVEGATSYSVGSDPNRHVVIAPSDDNPVKNNRPPRSRQRGGRGNGDRPTRGENRPEVSSERPVREVRKFVSRSNPVNIAEDYAPPERTQSEAEKNATLYGRIDL